MKYEVIVYCSGVTATMDIIEAPEDYTAKQYLDDCRGNADPEYVELLESNEFILSAIEEE